MNDKPQDERNEAKTDQEIYNETYDQSRQALERMRKEKSTLAVDTMTLGLDIMCEYPTVETVHSVLTPFAPPLIPEEGPMREGMCDAVHDYRTDHGLSVVQKAKPKADKGPTP